MSQKHIIVIIGASGVGLAAARRLASGRTIVLGARLPTTLSTAKEALEKEGHSVQTVEVHITCRDSVLAFAKAASEVGIIDVVLHTAGASPATAASADEIVSVDLLGAAYVIDAFLPYAVSGTSVIAISSMAAHLTFTLPYNLTPSLQRHLALAPVTELLKHPDLPEMNDTGLAYAIAKWANNLRVQGAAIAYGRVGARVNSVSPGLIMTNMGWQELNGVTGASSKAILGLAPMGRAATPTDVVNAVSFLAGPESQYMTGSDLRVDGGGVPAMRWLALQDGLEKEKKDGIGL